MERSETPYPADRQAPDPSPPAIRLAAALAERLDAVVPRPFRVRAEGGWVSLYRGSAWDGSSDVAGVLDQEADPEAPAGERGSFAWFAAMVAENVLSSVQDGVAEGTAEQWPALPQGGMALPGTRTDGQRVYLWYGADYERQVGAVLSFPPIPLAELAGSG
jgi:hypothetical protein